MEKLYSNSIAHYATIRTKKPSRIFIPKSIWAIVRDAVNPYYADIWIDDKCIKIVPNPTGEFTLSSNGNSPNGRNIALTRSAIEKYEIKDGHYRAQANKDDGVVTIDLSERIE